MKVWGKEVSCCNDCTYFYKDGDILECATDELKHLKSLDKVEYKMYAHEDCPFSKPITKEVIEKFGFIFRYNDFTFEVFNKTKDSISNYNLEYDYSSHWCTINTCNLDDTEIYSEIFKGEINNPEELRFILTSLGIIK